MSAFVSAAVGAVGAIGGAAISAGAASSAAKDQENAALSAQQIQEQQYQQIQANEQPFQDLGNSSVQNLGQLLGLGTDISGSSYGSLLKPFNAQTFQQMSPAYQFQAEQGRQGTLNGDAAGAGALSGAAQKDLVSFNQNFANTSFNNAFNQNLAQNQQIYSDLLGTAQLGQAAASQQAVSGTALAGNAGSAAISAGNAAANGQIGTANAYSNALTGGANAYGQYATLQALQGGGPGTFDTSGMSDINNTAFDQINSLIPGE